MKVTPEKSPIKTEMDYEEEGFVSNSSSNGTSYVPYRLRPETYIVPVIFAIIFIVGIVGNGTLTVMFAKNKSLRTVPNTYIISLALGDLLVLFFAVPFVSTVYTFESWPYGEAECKFSDIMKEVSVGVTVFTLTALSAERYLAIVSPVRQATASTSRFTVKIAISIWAFSAFLTIPSAIFSHVRRFDLSETMAIDVCFPFPDYLSMECIQFIVVVKVLVYYLIPLVMIGTFYLLMARHLFSATDKDLGSTPTFQRQVQIRRKIAKIVLCFVFIFAVCFLPSHIFMLWFYFDPNSVSKYNAYWHVLRITGFCLSFSNSCINPIALYCISGTFRKQYNKYLFRCFKRRSFQSPIISRYGDNRGSRYQSSMVRGTETMLMTTLLAEKTGKSPVIN